VPPPNASHRRGVTATPLPQWWGQFAFGSGLAAPLFTDTGLALNANNSIVTGDHGHDAVYLAGFEEMWAGELAPGQGRQHGPSPGLGRHRRPVKAVVIPMLGLTTMHFETL
jgi:hypothetical protein